jgi:hypothetical protein
VKSSPCRADFVGAGRDPDKVGAPPGGRTETADGIGARDGVGVSLFEKIMGVKFSGEGGTAGECLFKRGGSGGSRLDAGLKDRLVSYRIRNVSLPCLGRRRPRKKDSRRCGGATRQREVSPRFSVVSVSEPRVILRG